MAVVSQANWSSKIGAQDADYYASLAFNKPEWAAMIFDMFQWNEQPSLMRFFELFKTNGEFIYRNSTINWQEQGKLLNGALVSAVSVSSGTYTVTLDSSEAVSATNYPGTVGQQIVDNAGNIGTILTKPGSYVLTIRSVTGGALSIAVGSRLGLLAQLRTNAAPPVEATQWTPAHLTTGETFLGSSFAQEGNAMALMNWSAQDNAVFDLTALPKFNTLTTSLPGIPTMNGSMPTTSFVMANYARWIAMQKIYLELSGFFGRVITDATTLAANYYPGFDGVQAQVQTYGVQDPMPSSGFTLTNFQNVINRQLQSIVNLDSFLMVEGLGFSTLMDSYLQGLTTNVNLLQTAPKAFAPQTNDYVEIAAKKAKESDMSLASYFGWQSYNINTFEFNRLKKRFMPYYHSGISGSAYPFQNDCILIPTASNNITVGNRQVNIPSVSFGYRGVGGGSDVTFSGESNGMPFESKKFVVDAITSKIAGGQSAITTTLENTSEVVVSSMHTVMVQGASGFHWMYLS